MRMTISYHEAHRIIKQHVNAGINDVIITAGSGMTAVINKLQRILGLKSQKTKIDNDVHRPIVFITHMEHHSNQTSWYETNCDVVVLKPDANIFVDPNQLRIELENYKDREFKIGSFTACSNVTGIETPYHELAEIMHEYGGVCFVDFAASAPYVDINMHPANPMRKLDAIYFSPHKFLGGPGSSGALIFDASLYHAEVPDNPGGGTVDWTNPWGKYKYIDDIEVREDGGTPGFLQAIRAALAIKLKESMMVRNMRKREEELLQLAFPLLKKIQGLHILANNMEDRLGIISFYIDGIHYNLIVKLLSDRFGIQMRGGCACAGTYGHYLLEVSYEKSKEITDKINSGDLSEKPGWVRWSLHPTTLNEEVYFIIKAIKAIVTNINEWKKDYIYLNKTNEFFHKEAGKNEESDLKSWFEIK
jgi:selenocysteine lyase/cysteine desulfurase